MVGEILDRLPGVVERSYGEWISACPVCGDGKRRVLIRCDADGRVFLRCMRGHGRLELLDAIGLGADAHCPPGVKPRAPDPGWWTRPRRYARDPVTGDDGER